MPRPSRKTDYPPLLPEGFHPVTVERLRELCVDHAMFKYAKERGRLFDNLLAVLDRVGQSGIPFEVWVDGSFLTQKLNPDDVDVVLRIHVDDWNQATNEQRVQIDWISSHDCLSDYDFKGNYFLDCDAGHPEAAIGEINRKTWIYEFGYAANKIDPKGIAVLAL